MVIVHRTEEYLSHSGTKGMKWGYNDGQRNGKRTAAELKKVAEEKAKLDGKKSSDFEGDYHEANNMLKYLGITLDLQSDDVAVARTMAIYEEMRDSKDKYKTQYDWLNAFSNKLSAVGYDMKAVDDYLLQNKEKLNEIKVGSGSGNREKSNQDWADNTATTKSKSTKSSEKKEEETKTESNNSESNLAKETREHKEKRKGVKHSAMMDDKPGEYLEQHGILGQRWGYRRYQNADGSLTTLGRLRYGSSENYRYAQKKKAEQSKSKVSSRNKRIEAKLKKKYEPESKAKKLKNMTDDELRERINRLKLEEDYKTWNAKVNPEVKSKGRKFVEASKEVIAYSLKESAKDAGKALLTQYFKDKGSELLGVELKGDGKKKAKLVNQSAQQVSSKVQKLTEKAQKVEQKAIIKENKNKIKISNYDRDAARYRLKRAKSQNK